jgi:hypothetical protein
MMSAAEMRLIAENMRRKREQEGAAGASGGFAAVPGENPSRDGAANPDFDPDSRRD